MNLIITSGLVIVRKEFTMKKNTIAYSGIIFGFIVAAFLLAIIIPGRNVKADETSSDFYGDVWVGVPEQEPPSEWTLYTRVIMEPDTSNWHFQTINNHYNEYAEFGTGTYTIQAEHRIFSTQEVKACGSVNTTFSGDPVHIDIMMVVDDED